MQIKIEISEKELKQLVISRMVEVLGSVPLDESAVQILVKSKQNYKAEWENASFKAIYEVNA